MSLKMIAATGLIAALSLSAARPAAPMAPAPTSAPVTPPRMLRVHTRAPADAQRLISAGYDVMETRIGMDLLVLGDDSVLTRLRAGGYAVTDPGPDASRNAQTYYGGYRTVAEHEAHLAAAAAAHPDSARLFDFGDSWRAANAIPNGHVLKALCLTHHAQSNCARTPDNSKPRLFVLAAIHARELTPAEVAWRFIDYLLVNDGVNADVTWLLEYNEIWIVPLANPDGRSIVEQGGGSPYLQRKNARAPATCASTAAR